MGYLIESDYLPIIQVGNKSAMIQASPAIQATAEESAIEEAKSFLRQKYDVSGEFTDTAVWVRSSSYAASDRVYLTAAPWVTATSYAQYDLVLYTDGYVYQCATANSDVTFTPNKWTRLNPQYTIYYAKYPAPLFNLKSGVYKIGDEVFWKGKTYTCLQPTRGLDHETALQYATYQNLPYVNVFPDDPTNGATYWGDGVAYTVPANTNITNTTYWTKGDNRDKNIVRKLAIMTIYHLAPNVSPQNLPKNYVELYKGLDDQYQPGVEGTVYPVHSALGWLQACARGEVQPSLPLLQPEQGKRIRYGGPIKNTNTY